MGQEYTTSKGNRIFNSILALVMFGIAIFFFFTMQKALGVTPFVYLFPLLFLAVGAVIVVSAYRKKLVIYDDHIEYTGVFSSKTIFITDIKGYRITADKNSRNFVFVRNDGGIFKLAGYNDLANSSDITAWVSSNFEDLDAADLANETDKILHDTRFGLTEEERQLKLNSAKNVARIYNIVGVVTGIGMLFVKDQWGTIVLLSYPLISIIMMQQYKGLIKFMANTKRSPYPFMLIGFMAPAAVLLLSTIAKYHIFSPDNLWMPAIAVSIVVFAALFYTGINRAAGIAGQLAVMVLVALLYGAGSILRINCVFDDTVPKVYNATVFDRHVSHGKSTTYYLRISKWGPKTKPANESVSESMYNNTQEGDTVLIKYRPGKLNIPWYTLTREVKLQPSF